MTLHAEKTPGQITVLVAGGDTEGRSPILKNLCDAGWMAVEVREEREAVEVCRTALSSIAVVEISGNTHSAWPFCLALRGDAITQSVPVLAVVPAGDADAWQRAYDAGATEVIVDSVDVNVLSKRVARGLEERHAKETHMVCSQRLRLAQRIARIGLWECDIDGKVLYWDETCRELLGLDCAERPTDLVHVASALVEKDRERFMSFINRGLIGDELFSGEFRVRTGSGERSVAMTGERCMGRMAKPGFMGVLQDVTARRWAAQKIDKLRHLDNVTGLPNLAALRAEMSAAIRSNRGFAVLSIDIDGFRRINDSLGIRSADRLIRAVSSRLHAALRVRGSSDGGRAAGSRDILARGIGDGFIALLRDIRAAEDAAVITQRLRRSLLNPFVIDDKELHVRVSVGISVFPENGVSAEALLGAADAALTQAKRSGRDSWQFFKPEMNASAFKRLTIEMQLRGALRRDEFTLHYQPKVDMRTQRLVGFEALLRWNHPDLGLVGPTDFVPVVEEIGLMEPVGEWILAEACRQLRTWDESGLSELRCSVNLSSVQIRTANLVRRFTELVECERLEPSRIELELTESTLIADEALALKVLGDLRQSGFEVSIDDFGTGYSSLSYLQHLPLDGIKIDQSFVRGLSGSQSAATIVRAIVSMAHELSLTTVAEGVETIEQLKALQVIGCDQAQGYLFSAPRDADEIARWALDYRRTSMQPAMQAGGP